MLPLKRVGLFDPLVFIALHIGKIDQCSYYWFYGFDFTRTICLA
jgi:hypothetical protein